MRIEKHALEYLFGRIEFPARRLCLARKLAFNNYISKIPAVIKEMLGVVFYNTYEDDSRGRTYPTNSAANYVGIKEIRALISFANGESIGTLNKKALEDIFLK